MNNDINMEQMQDNVSEWSLMSNYKHLFQQASTIIMVVV